MDRTNDGGMTTRRPSDRIPVETLARRYVLRSLLERELEGFDQSEQRRNDPQWAAIRQSLGETLGYLNAMILYGEDNLAARLAGQPAELQPMPLADAHELAASHNGHQRRGDGSGGAASVRARAGAESAGRERLA